MIGVNCATVRDVTVNHNKVIYIVDDGNDNCHSDNDDSNDENDVCNENRCFPRPTHTWALIANSHTSVQMCDGLESVAHRLIDGHWLSDCPFARQLLRFPWLLNIPSCLGQMDSARCGE